MAEFDYSFLKDTPTASAWKKLGPKRRAGIMIPLFSIYSRQSAGVGEFADLELLGDWAKSCGLSLIQLLPVNDMGSRFCPYDAESSVALEPMHISLRDMPEAKMSVPAPKDPLYFDPAVKKIKLQELKKVFLKRSFKKDKAWQAFFEENRAWLLDHALFKVIKSRENERGWDTWPEPLKNRQPEALETVAKTYRQEMDFECWLQWQAASQLGSAAQALRKKGIRLVGDLPFLVARDSADVWAAPENFKLDLSAGAPPDLYFQDGQEWGMPPYNWDQMKQSDYAMLRTKLRFAEKFYDIYRIDHFVGLFRVWVFPRQGGEDRKKLAFFDPPEEERWEAQAREILRVMLEATSMLPCAEDLGTVPDRAREILLEYGIPGMDIQRWMRDWKGTGEFLSPSEYRKNAIATLSTHDMGAFEEWWASEATEDDRQRFERFMGGRIDEGTALLRQALEKVSESSAIFSIQSFQDWLGAAGVFPKKASGLRVNRPGLVDEKNWRLRVPRPLEEWGAFKTNAWMRRMLKGSSRND